MVVLFVWQIVTSSKTNQEVASLPPTILPATPTLHAYTTFFTSVPFARQFFVSAASLVMQVAGQLFVASLAGYAALRI